MKSTPYLTTTVFGAVAIVAMPFQVAQALNATEVGSIAEAVTVQIEGQNPGSGVMIKRQADVYTVLTAAHVVATEDVYNLVTPDGQPHQLDYRKVKKLPNVDLALVEFTSPKTYEVAEIGDSTAVKAGEPIYVSGFPIPTAAITESIWNFSEGKVTANSQRPLADGYALIYSNDTLPGMSGGAVLNSEGKLIAIHGRADTEQTIKKTETVYRKTGFNLGIPINTFLNVAANESPSLGFVSKATPSPGTTLTKDDWLLQGVDKYGKGNYSEAIKDFDQAIAIDPKDAVAYFNRGNTYDEIQQYDLAFKDYSRAININPEFVEAHNNRGIIYKEQQQYNLALKDFSLVIQLDPEQALAYNNRGTIYQNLNQHNLAFKDLSQAIQINPDFVEAYNNRGNTYQALKQQNLALNDYSRAIQINPEHASAYSNRGNTYYVLKKYDLALNDYSQAIQINPEYAAAYSNRGNIYYVLKKYDLALNDYSRAIQINPEYAAAYNNRGNIYRELQQANLALKDYSRAIQINPEDAAAYIKRGIISNEMGDKPQAKQDLQIAAQLFQQQNNLKLYQITVELLQSL